MTGADSAGVVTALIFLVFIGILYFIPAIIAFNRKHHNATAIFVVNLFLGWTFIGWVVALVWSCTMVVRPQT